jgi:hypothetical protein
MHPLLSELRPVASAIVAVPPVHESHTVQRQLKVHETRLAIDY